MKVNMPVTDKEVVMDEDGILVTRTDLKGRITDANEAFVRISGYSQQELIGKNHNIVRHPDMPPAAFEDLWKTVKSGKPWKGLVKNRTKSGDYYWVEANITPVTQSGKVIEYMSVRYAPSREQVREAERLYADINAGKATLESGGWRSKLNVFGKMKIWQKLTASAVVLLIPALVLLYLYVAEKQNSIEFAQKEIVGVEYLEPVRQMLVHTAQHRGLVQGYLSGEKAFKAGILQKRADVAEDIALIDGMEAKYGEELNASSGWNDIKNTWLALSEQALNLSASDSFARHTELIGKVLALIARVGDTSNLILDPDLDSYYLMDLVVVKIPDLVDRLGVLRGRMAGFAAKGSLILAERLALNGKIDIIAELAQATLRSVDVAIENNASLKPILAEKQQALRTVVNAYLNGVKQGMLDVEEMTYSSSRAFDEGTKSINAALTLYDTVSPTLKDLLGNRIDGFQSTLYLSLALVAAVALLAIGLIFWLIRYLNRSLSQVTTHFSRLSENHFRNDVNLKLKDEIGDLLCGLQNMQVKLNFELANAQQAAADSLRIKQALDTVNSNVMVADSDYNIIYLNNTVQAMFEEAQADIRKDLPDFDVSSLQGANIDVFHKNPAHQRAMLDRLSNTFRTSLQIGGRHLNFIANPVLNESGTRIGTVVEWLDRTHEVQIEKEIAGIVDGVKTGSLAQRINLDNKDGFFKTLSQGINELAETVEGVFTDINQVVNGMSGGDLTQSIEKDYQGSYNEAKQAINATQEKLNSVFGQINEAADFINNSSEEIASGNNNLSQRAEEQASSLEQTASSMEQLTSTVKNNAGNAQQANRVSSTAGQMAEKGGRVVSQAIAAMEEINVSSNKIAEIIGVIDEIAFQTNLLALNASVEAARAGEQGRGFSVVATEVRNLAQRCATAARESKDLIQTSVEKVRSGSELVNESGRTLQDIVQSVKKVGDIVAEIAAASAEQSSGIEQVNQAVSQMDEITQQNAALAEQASAASVSMSDQSKNMVQLMAFFKVTGGNSSTVGSQPGAVSRPTIAGKARRPASPSPAASGVGAAGLSDNDDWEEF